MRHHRTIPTITMLTLLIAGCTPLYGESDSRDGTDSDSETEGTDTTDSTGSTGAGDTATEPLCGDGVLDPGEECDDGADNAADAPCTSTCMNATCGDALVLAGVEDCDDGPDNDDQAYDGCTAACTLGPRCGDSEVNGPEACDDGAQNVDRPGYDQCSLACTLGPHCGDGEENGPEECDDANAEDAADDCNNSCTFNPRVVFVTSVQVRGDMSTFDENDVEPGGMGVEKADGWCQQLAEAAGLPGTYRAWLSDASEGPATRFDNVDVNPNAVPYADVHGAVIAASWSDLGGCPNNTCLLAAIRYSEMGLLLAGYYVWTNTSVVGGPTYDLIDFCCENWTSRDPPDPVLTGRVGQTGSVDSEWTDHNNYACNLTNRLYCFKQAPPPR